MTSGQTLSAPSILLLFGVYCNSFAHLPGLFARAGFAVDALVTGSNPVRRSRRLRRAYEVPACDAGYAERLWELLERQSYDYVWLVDEPVLALLSRAPQVSLTERFLPALMRSPLIRFGARKDHFQRWCEEHGVPTPYTTLHGDVHAAARECRQRSRPVVIKGAVGSGGAQVKVIREGEAADAFLETLQDQPAILVQDFAPGKVAAATFLSVHGRLAAWMATTKDLALLGGTGPTVCGRFLDDPRIFEMCRRFAEQGQLHGLTGFDFMATEAGEFLAIDPHFGRATTLAHMGRFCGVDFGEALMRSHRNQLDIAHPRATRARFGKYPEVIQLMFEAGPQNLRHYTRTGVGEVHWPMVSADDWRLGLEMSLRVTTSACRVALGSLRRRWTSRLSTTPSP